MDAADHAMLEALARHGRRHQIDDFLAQGTSCGWCRHPIRLRGYAVSSAGDRRSVFSSAALPDGVVLKACGARSSVRCPACATVYRGDARHLIQAGLQGGKGVPDAVAERPAVFLTLTAPSFGAVHTASSSGICHPRSGRARCAHGRPTQCGRRHGADDDALGTPLCLQCYDYVAAVVHNATTPELWRRTMIYAQRHLAAVLGVSQAKASKLLVLSFCRVAEFQRRGVVHLHAVIRIDHFDGAAPPLEADRLARACVEGAHSVSVATSAGCARWGVEIDVQVLGEGDDRAGRVASYLAKYATKSSSEDPRLDARILSLEDLEARNLPAHLHAMVATALELDANPAMQHLHLARYAHRLGFGGHFLTKSRGYSTTFGALRQARVDWREAKRLGDNDPEDHRIEGHWRAIGAGWANRGEELFAALQQRQRSEDRREVMSEWYCRSE
jgi:hypothetical protein